MISWFQFVDKVVDVPVLCTTGAWCRRAENCGDAAFAFREPVHLGEPRGESTGAAPGRGTLDADSGGASNSVHRRSLWTRCLATETGSHSASCAVGLWTSL